MAQHGYLACFSVNTNSFLWLCHNKSQHGILQMKAFNVKPQVEMFTD